MADLMTLRRNIIASKAEKPVAKVYGVEWNYADPSTVLKRTGAAANFANPIPAESLNEVGWSPFDNLYPWSEMKRYNIINGEVAYSEDDAGYSETDYDTMVYIPEFYYYANKNTTSQKWNWSISANPLEGYAKHPGSGRYVGRFHTSGSSSSIFSRSGVAPLTNLTRANFRTYSHNKGSNWWQIDLATWSAIQMLYIVEFANWNSQDVLGMGNNTMAIKNTGETTGAAYHTVKRTGLFNLYRWIESLFSNAYTFIDGFVNNRGVAYIGIDNSQFNDTTDGLANANITFPSSGYEGFITNIGYNPAYSWAFIPNERIGGSALSFIPDYLYSCNDRTGILYAGGGYSNINNYGLFCIDVGNLNSLTAQNISSRIIYIPTT